MVDPAHRSTVTANHVDPSTRPGNDIPVRGELNQRQKCWSGHAAFRRHEGHRAAYILLRAAGSCDAHLPAHEIRARALRLNA